MAEKRLDLSATVSELLEGQIFERFEIRKRIHGDAPEEADSRFMFMELEQDLGRLAPHTEYAPPIASLKFDIVDDPESGHRFLTVFAEIRRHSKDSMTTNAEFLGYEPTEAWQLAQGTKTI